MIKDLMDKYLHHDEVIFGHLFNPSIKCPHNFEMNKEKTELIIYEKQKSATKLKSLMQLLGGGSGGMDGGQIQNKGLNKWYPFASSSNVKNPPPKQDYHDYDYYQNDYQQDQGDDDKDDDRYFRRDEEDEQMDQDEYYYGYNNYEDRNDEYMDEHDAIQQLFRQQQIQKLKRACQEIKSLPQRQGEQYKFAQFMAQKQKTLPGDREKLMMKNISNQQVHEQDDEDDDWQTDQEEEEEEEEEKEGNIYQDQRYI